MTVRLFKIVPTTQLTASSVQYGTTVPAGVIVVIKRAVFSNTGTVPRTIQVNIVPTAGSATVANQIINPNGRTLQPGETYVSPELAGLELIAGDMIFAQASAATDVNVTISGSQIS